ncbi:MAG: TetR family transcriptional regulator [Chloroflexi bacterium]|nr:MAG: TetR family transcriptional regulator [Chloroflexota bacterium]
MSPRKVDTEARKEQILAAAMQVFAQKGLDGATMDDIVRASGLSKGGLYWHFKGKDDIIMSILTQFFDQELAVLEEIRGADISASDRLRQLAAQIMADLEMLAPMLAISLEFYALAARREEVRVFIREYYGRYRAALSALLAEGIERGEFRSVPSVEAIANTLIAQLEGIMLVWSINPEAFELRVQVETAVELILAALVPHKGETGHDS